jgi:hypothetical protein
MLHVPKTGGTAVKAALAGQTPPGVRLLLHSLGVALADLPPDDELFLFLRDPVARFVSGFEGRRREGRPAHYRPWTPAERRAFERFPSADVLALALRSDKDDERQRAQAAMKIIRHGRDHFSDWLGDSDLVRSRRDRILLIGWQETLEQDFAALRGLLGLPADIRLPADQAVAHRADPRNAAGRQLSPAAAEAIRDWYAADYALIDLLEGLGLTRRPGAVPDRASSQQM